MRVTPGKVVMLLLQICFGLLTLVKLTARWLKAKVTGKPYDSGMDT